MERALKDILYNALMMTGIAIVLVGGAVLAYKASEPKDLKESADGYYEIYTAYDYERFWQKVTHNMPFVCGRLMQDIYLNDITEYENWENEVLARRNREVLLFTGDFDGNGHTIYGLYSENGYGMVEKNEGNIHDLTIKRSLVTGEKDLGGICLYNCGTISSCEFDGELKSLTPETDAYSRMAGISLENSGMIERCGYRGSMTACEQSEHRRKAGISIMNGGEIVNCYNFTWEHMDKEDNFFYSITNFGEKSCFVREDVRWNTFHHGQIIPLDGIQELYLEAFLDKDLYTIYFGLLNFPACFQQAAQMMEELDRIKWSWDDYEENKIYGTVRIPIAEGEEFLKQSMEDKTGQKMLKEIGIEEKQDALREALLDKNVCNLIWGVLVYEGINWESVALEGVTQGENPLFEVQVYNRYHQEQSVSLSGYEMKSGEKMNCDAIWDFCTELLMEEDAESWQHDTWRIFDGLMQQEDGLFILYQTRKGESGFFYAADEMLYQIKMQGAAKEANGQEKGIQKISMEKEKIGKILDMLSVKACINNYILNEEWEDLEGTDNTQIYNKIWRVMVERIWEDKMVGYVY